MIIEDEDGVSKTAHRGEVPERGQPASPDPPSGLLGPTHGVTSHAPKKNV